uniref:Zinc finger FYVE-type containing 1 n=1 Tax=Hucho hucho TaxID=62062 RepID=A0A4W5KXS0_9TELE
MSGQGPSVDKGINAIPVCQESYACGGSDEAAFECDECGSLQCVRCELELHRQERMRNHDRVRIGPGHVPFCDSCKGDSSGVGVNGGRLRAVGRCQGCKINLCLDCQKRTHSGVNKRKHPVTPYLPPGKAQDSSLDTGDGGEMEALKAKLEKVCSFLLVDEKEEMQLKDEEDFVSRLDCRPEELLKVVSIFGNTGEGKSHTLNHTFFLGREVFQTSPTQESCTVGVWAAMDPIHRVVVIDTEGLLGAGTQLYMSKCGTGAGNTLSTAVREHSSEGAQSGCVNSMNHLKEEVDHEAKHRCRYSAQYDNRIYTCKACYEGGKEVIVVPKTTASSDSPWFGLAIYAWSGYVIECPNCGVIYRSRQYWYGNQDPVDTVVRTEIEHIWPGSDGFLKDNNNAAQRLLDGVNYISQSVSELSVKPAKAVTSWLTDQIAPAYWKPNSLILECAKCSEVFQDNDTKHHCRACGEGFCDSCSTKNRPVPERGWGLAPVRVCDACFQNRELLDAALEEEEGGTLSRRVGEAVQNTLGAVVTATYIPLGLMKDAARPAYWVPDQNIRCCCECQRDFSAPRLSIHHCRACGQGVCDDCSPERRAVPSKGWDHPVRVCNTCHQKPGDL